LRRTAKLRSAIAATYCGGQRNCRDSNILRGKAPLQSTAIYCGVQRHCSHIAEYGGIAEVINILRSAASLLRTATYCRIQRNYRGQQHISEYRGIAEDSNILRSTAELQRTATYFGVSTATVRRTVAVRRTEHLQKAATFEDKTF
jgi:hypothetical protein